MPYHLNLTLRQKATLSAAISVWNSQKAKDKIFKWSDDNLQTLELDGAERDAWQKLTEEVLKEVNQIVLPSLLTNELIHVVKALGEKIHNWSTYIWMEYFYLYRKEGDITNYVREIYWTPIGTIDEVKILQEFWLKNPNLNVAVVYNIACKNALEKDINDLWQKKPRSIQDCYDKFNMPDNRHILFEDPFYDYLILVYWKCRTVGRIDSFYRVIHPDDPFGNNDMRFWHNQNYSQNYKMFLLSVYKGYNTAVKYFWKKLTEEEKDCSVLYAAYLAVVRSIYVYQLGYIEKYIKEKYVEILIFLLNQMTMNQIKSFLRGDSVPNEVNVFNIDIKKVKVEILFILSCIWPWQELFIPALENMMQYLEHDTDPVLKALWEISRNMVKPSYAAENSKYQSMLRDAWFLIPGSMKRMMVQKLNDSEYSRRFNCITYLLEIGDFGGFKIIFNDPEITDVRMQYIKFGKYRYKSLIMSNEYALLDHFVEKVLRFEEEIIYCKIAIDHFSLYQQFLKTGKFNLADKLLDWLFGTVEERKQCKDHFKNYEFTIDLVFKTLKSCGGSVDETKKTTSRFFEWLLESEDDIAVFKKDCIANSEPLVGREISTDAFCDTISEENAQKIRQILA